MPKSTPVVRTYEVGVKNRKPFTIRADKFSAGAFEGDLKFSLNGELVYVIHRHKWDYVRIIEASEAQAG